VFCQLFVLESTGQGWHYPPHQRLQKFGSVSQDAVVTCVAGYRLFGTSLDVTHILSVAPVVTNVTRDNQHNESSRDLKVLFVCLSAPALGFFGFNGHLLSLGFSAGAQVAGLGLVPQRGAPRRVSYRDRVIQHVACTTSGIL
jgi:hypothetical protein